MKYTARLTAPADNDKSYIHYSKGGYNTAIMIDPSTGSVLPNCVGYACGRQLELTGAKSPNWKIPVCNAEDCYDQAIKNGYKVGQTPKLGACIVWRAGKTHNGSDGAGHIAVVEEIKSNGDIVVSQSAYGGERFYLKTVTKASGYIYSSNRPLVGFIYCPIEFEQPETVTTTPAVKKYELKNTTVYNSESGNAIGLRSGTYYLWDNVVKNGRIRMTNDPKKIGVAGQVSFWVDSVSLGISSQLTAKAGIKVTLNNTKCYSSESAKDPYDTKSGTYYLWDDQVKSGRIRITNTPERVGVKGQVTCWVNVKDI